MYVDMHVNKMLVESAQIMCTAINVKAGSKITPYRNNNPNHPCVLWAGRSFENFEWLYNLMFVLKEEWNWRKEHNKEHLTITKMQEANLLILGKYYLHSNGFTPVALAMPTQYRGDDAIVSYRNYYKYAKWELHQWTRRETPTWILS